MSLTSYRAAPPRVTVLCCRAETSAGSLWSIRDTNASVISGGDGVSMVDDVMNGFVELF